nr:diguanylate cyclase [Paenisporosarcina sp. OV554]
MKISIMFIDLGRFKYINDTLGHTLGDQLLIEVAQLIQGCVVKEDTVILRSSCLGGVRNSDSMHNIKEEIVDWLKNTLLNT